MPESLLERHTVLCLLAAAEFRNLSEILPEEILKIRCLELADIWTELAAIKRVLH